jgi:hypothetical protein
VSLRNISKSLHMSFAALAHLAEGLCLRALLTLKVEKSLIINNNNNNNTSNH